MQLSTTTFIHQARTRILFGCGMLEQLGAQAAEIGAKRAVIVTDAGIVAAGHVERAQKLLRDAGIEVAVFDRVVENPTTREVEHCVEFAREVHAELLIGLGGGSSMDTAKGCNFILTNSGVMRDYQGYGKARQPMLPLIAIPTTAGTGSECQSYALISDPETHQKMACGDPKASAAVALLDPLLTLTQPAFVTACTGIDALAHAVETAVTRRRNPYSQLFSHEAFRLLFEGFPRVINEPDDLEARSRMLLGAAFAGIAIEHSMLGAAHSAANPLTAHYGIVHGQAVGTMLPHVIRFNAQDVEIAGIYHSLIAGGANGSGAAAAQKKVSGGDQPLRDAIERMIAELSAYLRLAGFPADVSASVGREPDIGLLAREAAGQWTAQFNPRPVGAEHFAELYRRAFSETAAE